MSFRRSSRMHMQSIKLWDHNLQYCTGKIKGRKYKMAASMKPFENGMGRESVRVI